jgi:hypothetical protein
VFTAPPFHWCFAKASWSAGQLGPAALALIVG